MEEKREYRLTVERVYFQYRVIFCSVKKGWGFRQEMSYRGLDSSCYVVKDKVEILPPDELKRRMRGDDRDNEFSVYQRPVRTGKGCPLCGNGWFFKCRCNYVSCIRSDHEGIFECPVCGAGLETVTVEWGLKSWPGFFSSEPARPRLSEPHAWGALDEKKRDDGAARQKLRQFLAEQKKEKKRD